MGKISARPIFHGFIRSGPDAASMVMASKMMVMMALSMMPIMVMRTFPRRSGDDGPPPNGGDESTDWGAGDEGDDDDDPELPLRGTKVFDHKTSNCLAGHACRGRPTRMQRCLDADSGAIVGPVGRPTSEARATALEWDTQIPQHQSDKEYNETSRWHENEKEDQDDGTEDHT